MSTGFRYSDVAQSTNSLKVLIPEKYRNDQVASVQLIDGKGRVIETGDYKRFADNRENYHFDKKGYMYPADTKVRLILKNGQQEVFNPKDGLKPGEPGPGHPESTYQGIEGPGGAAYKGGGGIAYSPGGNAYVQPGAFNFAGIPIPNVNYDDIYNSAVDVAKGNRDNYFEEIRGKDAHDAAMDILNTDIEGINKGLDTFIPRIRAEGDKDTETNIARAGTIDAFNESRLPGMNEFNRNEVAANNTFNQQQRAEAVDSSGINYRERTGELLDQLQHQSKGELSPEMGSALDKSLANRGAELSGTSGVASTSRAGIRANDRMTINERLDLQRDAQHQLPGVLTQAQQILMSPEERAPTLFMQPTNVPLNTSNVADRIPIQSNISAGQTQLHIGEKANQIGTIDATHVLDTHLATEQFNQSAGFNAGVTLGTLQQNQMTAADNATQGALNADKNDQRFEAGLDAQTRAGNIQAITAGIGAIGGIASTNPGSGGIGGVISEVGSTIGGGIASAANWGAQQFGYDDTTSMGGESATAAMYHDLIGGGSGSRPYGMVDPSTVMSPAPQGFGNSGGSSGGSSGGGEYIPDEVIQAGGGYTEDGSVGSSNADDGVPNVTLGDDIGGNAKSNIFQRSVKAGSDTAHDAKTVAQGATTVSNWSQFTPAQQLSSAGSLAAVAGKNVGVISAEDAHHISNISNALAVVADPSSSTLQKTSAIATAAAGAVTTSFTGNVNQPNTIGGNKVIGSTTVDGKAGFLVQDSKGNVSSVAQQDLVDSSNTAAALSTFGVLTSKAPTSDKIAALAALGIKAGAANNIISQVQGGNLVAALQIFQTGKNFDQMTPLQKAVSSIQTSSAVLQVANGINSSLAGTSAAASQLAYSSATAAGVAQAAGYLGTAGQVAAGAYTAYQVGKGLLANNKAPSSVRTKENSKMVGNAVTGIGGIPFAGKAVNKAMANPTSAAIGALILGPAALPYVAGAALSIGGTGKNTGQILRDNYRKGLKDGGIIATDKDGAYNVKLADGSSYDLGKDGGAKLKNAGTNIDGKTERNTYDVDWSNPVAVASIPDAHIFALATGLDPANADKHGLFDRSVAQVLNAATSNTKDANGVRENFRTMLGDKVDPAQVAGKVELLRAQNNISDQEYGVYLDHINKMFGTEFSPTDKQQSASDLVGALQSKSKLSKDEKELLNSLTDKKTLEKNAEKLNKRLGQAVDETRPAIETTATDITPLKDPPRKPQTPALKDPPRRVEPVKPTITLARPQPRTNTGAVAPAVMKDINRIRQNRAQWA